MKTITITYGLDNTDVMTQILTFDSAIKKFLKAVLGHESEASGAGAGFGARDIDFEIEDDRVEDVVAAFGRGMPNVTVYVQS